MAKAHLFGWFFCAYHIFILQGGIYNNNTTFSDFYSDLSSIQT